VVAITEEDAALLDTLRKREAAWKVACPVCVAIEREACTERRPPYETREPDGTVILNHGPPRALAVPHDERVAAGQEARDE
jgi:hypothetical protein